MAGCISDFSGDGCAPGRSLNGAYSVTVSPAGESVYVASVDAGVAAFARGRGGALKQSPGAGGCYGRIGDDSCAGVRGLGEPLSVALSPDGASAYVASHAGLSVFDRTVSTRPLISALVVSPDRFTAMGRGAIVAYLLSEPATTRVEIQRALGRRRYETIRRFTQRGGTGQSTVRLRGLRPGRYILRGVATDRSGNRSLAQRTGFRVRSP